MRHIKTFESFSHLNEEEIIGKLFGSSEISKSISKFIELNKREFDELKIAEKKGGELLKTIQTNLLKKLQEYKLQIRKELKDPSDYKTAVREITDKITNINADDTRSTMQKITSGVSGGFPGSERRK